MDQAEDGTIHLNYDHKRYVSGDIIHVELTEDQIRKRTSEIKRELISQYTGRGRHTPVDEANEQAEAFYSKKAISRVKYANSKQ